MFYNKTQRESGRSKSVLQQKPASGLKAWTLVVFLFCFQFSIAQEQDALQELLETIDKAPEYDAEKLERIQILRLELENSQESDLIRQHNLNRELMHEYKVFKQDSAFFYALRTRELARELQDKEMIADANINLADINITAGMYKEALDFLRAINPEEVPENIRSLYYGLLGRCYSEMAEYSNLPYFSSEYNRLAAQYRKSALELTEPDTFFNSFLKGFIQNKSGNLQEALSNYLELEGQELNLREMALVQYSLGDLYVQLEERDSAITHFAHAAIADIKTATKENLALIRLAELLFERGDFRNASIFIQKANDDAAFYGAQQRKIRVGAILPLIEEEIVQKIEEQRARLHRQNIIGTFLLIFVMGLVVVIYSQVTRLKKARAIIEEAHENLQETNQQIVLVNEQIKSKNAQLNDLNSQLSEANKIKEEYIGFFFTQDADIFEKFREFKTEVEKDLKEENLKKLKYTVNQLNLKREKEKLLRNFDEAFIKLFPKFIQEFNSLLKPEEQIKVKKGQILNKELRIFALMRLGIKHNEIIAQILGYSVNSIYAYKTKIRKKSRLDKKDFDEKLIENTTLKL